VSIRRCRPICKCKKGLVINNNVFVKVVVALFFDLYLMWVPCVVVGPGTVFFIIDRIVVHKGLRYFSSPPLSLLCSFARMYLHS
jgi:hypothetical protein